MFEILSYRHWAINQDFADRVGLLALKLLSEGKSIAHLITKKTGEELHQARYASLPAAADNLVVSTEWDRELQMETATTQFGQRVAVIPVIGGLTKRGDLCSYGMRDYIGMIDRANASQKVAAIVLDIESPGGTVDGTNEFGLAIKQSKKPVVAFGDGMVASAAYWIASQAKEIIANKNNATEFGSIGVLYMHENYQAYIQKEIGSVEIIRAPQSVDKARVNVIEPLTEDQRASIKAELKTIASEFFSTVKKGRGARLNTGEENIFTGKMYPAKEALSYGMIDKLDTLQGAINRAGMLALSPSTSAPANGAQVNTEMKFRSNLLSNLFGKAGKAEDQPAAELSPMEQADTHVAGLEAENATLKEANVQLTADITAANASMATLQASVTELQTQVSTLEAERTALQATVAEQKEALAKKPTGSLTTVIADPEKEAEIAGDPKVVAKSFKTKADAEVEEYLNYGKK